MWCGLNLLGTRSNISALISMSALFRIFYSHFILAFIFYFRFIFGVYFLFSLYLGYYFLFSPPVRALWPRTGGKIVSIILCFGLFYGLFFISTFGFQLPLILYFSLRAWSYFVFWRIWRLSERSDPEVFDCCEQEILKVASERKFASDHERR